MSSPSGPTSSGPCARSPRGSAPPPTCPAVLQLGVDEAARLLRADGARIDLIDPTLGLLRWAYASGAIQPSDEEWPDDPDETLDQGISGKAVVSGRAFWSGDYVNDTRFSHGRGADQYVSGSGLHSVMAAPLTVEGGADRRADRLHAAGPTPGARRTAACSRRSRTRQPSRSGPPA